MTFELFERRWRWRHSRPGPRVTVTRRGMLALNEEAFGALGDPGRIHFVFDRAERVIGLKAASPFSPDSYVLSPHNVGRQRHVCARAFLRYVGVSWDVATSWRAEMDGGVLCVDLTQEPIVVSSNRAHMETAS